MFALAAAPWALATAAHLHVVSVFANEDRGRFDAQLVVQGAGCSVRRGLGGASRLVGITASGPDGSTTELRATGDPGELRTRGRVDPLRVVHGDPSLFAHPGAWSLSFRLPCDPPLTATWTVVVEPRDPAEPADRLEGRLAEVASAPPHPIDELLRREILRDLEVVEAPRRAELVEGFLASAVVWPDGAAFVSELLALRPTDPAAVGLEAETGIGLAMALWALARGRTATDEERSTLVARGLDAGGTLAGLALAASAPASTAPPTRPERIALLHSLAGTRDPSVLPVVLAIVTEDATWRAPPRTAPTDGPAIGLRQFQEERDADDDTLSLAAVFALGRVEGARLPLARALAAGARSGTRAFEAIEALIVLTGAQPSCGVVPADVAALADRWAEWVEEHAAALATDARFGPDQLPSRSRDCTGESYE